MRTTERPTIDFGPIDPLFRFGQLHDLFATLQPIQNDSFRATFNYLSRVALFYTSLRDNGLNRFYCVYALLTTMKYTIFIKTLLKFALILAYVQVMTYFWSYKAVRCCFYSNFNIYHYENNQLQQFTRSMASGIKRRRGSLGFNFVHHQN